MDLQEKVSEMQAKKELSAFPNQMQILNAMDYTIFSELRVVLTNVEPTILKMHLHKSDDRKQS